MKISSLTKFSAAVLTTSFLISSPVKAEANLRVGALSALAGVADVFLDFKISEYWTLGPSAQYLNRRIGDYDARAYSLGIRGNYYLGHTALTQGWYIGPSISYTDVKVIDDETFTQNLEGKASGVTLGAMVGYQWMWEKFNINFGLGPVYHMVGTIDVESEDGTMKESFDNYDSLALGGEFTLGWKF